MDRPDTLVFQSYRAGEGAPWLERCLASAAAWARMQGHAHVLLDDAFFDIVPGWYAARCGSERLPVTDLARLLWARRYLAEGWRRVIWLDADVLVTAPAAFVLGRGAAHALGREYWLWREADGALRGRWSINNCMMQFTAASTLLPFYIDACETIVRAAGTVHRLIVGPTLLTALDAAVPLPLVAGLATLSPLLIDEIAGGVGGGAVAAHAAAWGAPVHAVHLCRSIVTGEGGLSLIGEAQVAAAAARLTAEPGLLDPLATASAAP